MVIKDGLCIKKIKEYYAEFKKELDSKKKGVIEIDFKEAQRIDLAMVQLLMAARCAARRLDKELEFKNINARIKSQLDICGMRL